MADWSFFISVDASGRFDSGIHFKNIDPRVATTLIMGAYYEFEKMKDELDEYIFYSGITVTVY